MYLLEIFASERRIHERSNREVKTVYEDHRQWDWLYLYGTYFTSSKSHTYNTIVTSQSLRKGKKVKGEESERERVPIRLIISQQFLDTRPPYFNSMVRKDKLGLSFTYVYARNLYDSGHKTGKHP